MGVVLRFLLLWWPLLVLATTECSSCRSTCGSLQVKYPFGTGQGCGSPRFHPYVSCDEESLVLSTHSGSYPITSISYATSTLTLSPSTMSTCSSMLPCSTHNFGLDQPGPFSLGPSTFVLLSCNASIVTLASPAICDPTSHLCASLYACPSVSSLGLPLFPPTNTCCVYSPATLDRNDELDLRALGCRAFASIVSLRSSPTDPATWDYGVAVTYNAGVLESSVLETRCRSCELSDGVCGYSTSEDNNSYSFLCVCKEGVNTTTACANALTATSQVEDVFWSSSAFLITTTLHFLLLFTSSFLLWG